MENKKYIGVNFKEMLSDFAGIDEILKCIGLEHMQVEEILSSYEKNSNRCGVIFMAKDNKTEKLQKIIIDAIDGELNLTQIKELIYDQGFECEERIIIYTFENSIYLKDEFYYESKMLERFAKGINDYGFEIFVVNVSLDSPEKYNYEAKIYPDEDKWTSLNKSPTQQKFEQHIFEVIYDETDRFDDADNFYVANVDYIFPVWNENGLFVQADSTTQKGIDILRSVQNNYQNNLRQMFVNREIMFKENASEGVTMTIKLWDKPLSFFVKASEEDKVRIAERLHHLHFHAFDFLSDCHCLERGYNRGIEKYEVIPEDAFDQFEKVISD